MKNFIKEKQLKDIIEGLRYIANSGDGSSIQLSNKSCKYLLEKIEKLEEENKKLKSYMQDTYDSANDICGELQQRIDKAIKHIETHQLCYQSQYEEMSGFDNHLLDILKGENNG